MWITGNREQLLLCYGIVVYSTKRFNRINMSMSTLFLACHLNSKWKKNIELSSMNSDKSFRWIFFIRSFSNWTFCAAFNSNTTSLEVQWNINENIKIRMNPFLGVHRTKFAYEMKVCVYRVLCTTESKCTELSCWFEFSMSLGR